MLYIDFDGVILDTIPLLFEEWKKNPDRHSLPESAKIKYMQEANWDYILHNSKIINDSIYYLQNMDPNISIILTKIHSQEEGVAKVRWLREQGVKQIVVLAPYQVKKTDLVDANGNILVDDYLKNLDDWVESGGIPVFFDSDNDGLDNWHQPNVKQYRKVLDLSQIYK